MKLGIGYDASFCLHMFAFQGEAARVSYAENRGDYWTRYSSPSSFVLTGRFGTKGLAISFVSTESDAKKLEEVQSRFEVDIPELPDQIETSTYMQSAS